VVSSLHNDEFVVAVLVHKSVFMADPARPAPGGLYERLSDALSRVSRSLLDHAVDPLQDRTVAD
jgi:hypothetical protein